ncbi:MAG: helix-turn-helix transcriptional regulator [Cyanobacteria bacterium P01_F01_bin.150]
MKTLRLRSGLSQEALAKSVGKTVSAVSKWDQGKSFPALYPSETVLLTQVLDCTLDELVEAERFWRASKQAK